VGTTDIRAGFTWRSLLQDTDERVRFKRTSQAAIVELIVGHDGKGHSLCE